MKNFIEETLNDFRNRFGWKVWIDTDVSEIESFFRSALAEAIKKTAERMVVGKNYGMTLEPDRKKGWADARQEQLRIGDEIVKEVEK